MIFVTLGTQKFPMSRLLVEIDRLISIGKIQEDVFVQTGWTEYDSKNFKCEKFISMQDFDNFMEKADLVITHSGEGSIITSLRKDKKTVVVPRLAEFGEHVDNHQLEIAKAFKDQNLVEVCYDISKLGEHIDAVRTKKFARFECGEKNMGSIIEEYLGKDSLKILQINTVPFKRDGIVAVILNYAKNMNKSNLQIDFVAMNEMENDLKKEFEAVGKIHILKMRNKNPIAYILKLSKIIRKEKYDVVHIHGNSCTLAVDLFAAKIGGAKVRIAHSHNSRCKHTFFNKILRLPFNLFYTHGLACSEMAGKWLFKNKPFKILQNAIDLEKYKFKELKRNEFRDKYNINGKIAIAHIATLSNEKNHKFILDVLKKIVSKNGDYILFLIGDGELRNEIENKVKIFKLENNVVFTGSVQNVHELLNAMDLLVLPSLYEGLPVIAIEAQANGLPMLLSDNVSKECKITDLVEFLPLEAEKWVEKIFEKKISENRIAISNNAVENLKNTGFDIKKEAMNLRNIYI